MSGPLAWSEAVGKRVRVGDWPEQAVATTRRVAEAIRAERWEEAAQLVDYFMEEAKVCHVVYRTWSAGFDAYLRRRGLREDELAAERDRLARMLRFPDGAPFEPSGRWSDLGARAGRLANELRGLEVGAEAALERFDALREAWRELHDRWADYQAGLLTLVADRFGEAAVGDCYAEVLEPYLAERYAPFDTRRRPYAETLERNLYIAFESMRAHLVGPERMGDVGLTEHDDRWVLEFDPCGSGGRHTPADGFAVTRERHDWAGNRRGVCLYCAHCVVALQKWPIEQWGTPVRVVDPPVHGDGAEPGPCRWTIYKDPGAVPAEAYRSVGAEPPRR
ncbi:MAG: hypothetical protein IRZ32_08460 [Solirubrobacteraceae bacterium]|nr:hypothetical protein [Solirubrobacteraceae bacterium]